MDPLSQGTLGSVFSLSAARKTEFLFALLIGALSGMAPDLDILIRSSTDPMVYFKYHRHFTHSIFFIPIGALICTAVLHRFLQKFTRSKVSFKRAYIYSFLGYASHGVLDSCTSYGTLLFWPLSDRRVAWDIVSIIDPIFTFPIFFMVLMSWKKESRWWAFGALAFGTCYMLLGMHQRNKAIAVIAELAESRGHTPDRIHAKPSFANNIVFRGIYEHSGVFQVDAIRVPWWGQSKVYPGLSKKRVRPEELIPDTTSQSRIDLEKFKWFSDGFLVRSNHDPHTINDFRYSQIPNSGEELWGVTYDPNNIDAHITRSFQREVSSERLDQFKKMLLGENL